jgi:predicted dehydrogenase
MTRYAIVGTGSRATLYIDAICGTYSDHCELVAMCDTSSVRISYHNRRLSERYGHDEVPGYPAGEFGRMLAERRLTVTFNYRYSPAYTKVKQLVADGAIGTPRLVDFSWLLDTSHGADYFRRWHREKDSSGGLLVHKATHHFDLINWWIDAWPASVYALGSLSFYGQRAAAGRGESYAYARYTGQGSPDDPFALDLSRSPMLRGLYLDAEEETGYLRDRNVFGEPISIEDTMAVTARYRSGALLSYSLVAYSPWEGLRVAITGDKGRLELDERQGAHIIERTPTGEGGQETDQRLTLFPMFRRPAEIAIQTEGGPHGGDAEMLEQIFGQNPPPDRWSRSASHLDGAASVLLGDAANRSLAEGRPVTIELAR